MAERPLGLVRLPARRPRTIRKITHWSNVGTPKQVKDFRMNVSIRWIRAINPHTCAAGKRCRQGGVIQPKTIYAQLILSISRARSVYGGRIPMAEKRHLGCVPEDWYPLMRLLLPVRTRAYSPRRKRLTWY